MHFTGIVKCMNVRNSFPVASDVIATLELVWTQLRTIHSKVPDAVIIVLDAQNTAGGHFAHSRWRRLRSAGSRAEVAISATKLWRPWDAIETMLHEAAHAALWPDQKGGIGSGGYYHLRSFRNQCIEFGLICGFLNTRYGWCETAWPAGSRPAAYRGLASTLVQGLRIAAGRPGQPKTVQSNPLPKSGRLPLECSCTPPRLLYASARVATAGEVLCGLCQAEFRPSKARS